MIGSRLSEVNLSLVEAAMGRVKPDLAVRNVNLIDVYTGEILERVDIAVKGDRIAYVGPADSQNPASKALKQVDGRGMYAAPGLIDPHIHVDVYCTPMEMGKLSITHGTTTIFTEPDELVASMGYEGLKLFRRMLRSAPVRGYLLIPVMPLDRRLGGSLGLTPRQTWEALQWRETVGLGEVAAWSRVTAGEREPLHVIRLALKAGKLVEGHTAGARGGKLAAYTAAGVSSCHEPISGEQALERLRLGFFVMLREGSIRRDLKATLPSLLAAKVSLENVALSTDGLYPDEALKQGHMDWLVREAIQLGVDPVRAVQMATVNPARHFHLEGEIGGIAPARYADLILVDSPEKFNVKLVVCGGQPAAREGRFLGFTPQVKYSRRALQTIKVKLETTAETFKVKAWKGLSRVRVIQLAGETITREQVEALPTRGGEILLPEGRDMLKVAVINKRDGRVAVGFLKGYGCTLGAIATTINITLNHILVAGGSDGDMALAVERLKQLGGGIVVAEKGRVKAEAPMPIGGLMSPEPLEKVSRRLEAIRSLLKLKGCPFENPLNPIHFLTFTSLPELRITDKGLVDVKRRRLVPLAAT